MTAMDTDLRPISFTSAVLATTCAALWGGLAVAVRYTQEELPPLATAGCRFALGAALLAPTVVAGRAPR